MKIGLQIPRFKWPGGAEKLGETLAKIAGTAEDVGFYSIWVMDHFFQMDPMFAPATDPMLEAYSTLGYLAGITSRVRLGTLVTGVIYRHPGVLVKTATTLDVISGGRAYLGIGAAWYEREAVGLGVPFPPLKERYEILEETLQVAKQMWSGDTGPYEGRHLRLAETICSPMPVTKPHPPIMVGGRGEKKTLRLVAKYADACNIVAAMSLDELKRKLDVLKGHCDDVGRPYDEIERTALSMPGRVPDDASPSDVIKICRELAGVGFQHVIFNMPNDHEIRPLEIFGREIIPEVSGL